MLQEEKQTSVNCGIIRNSWINYLLITFRVQLRQISYGQPTNTAQATPSPTLQPKLSSAAKPVVTKDDEEFQNIYDSPGAIPTTPKATNPLVFANVAAGGDEYMQIESLQNSPPLLPPMKQSTPTADQEEVQL